MDLGNHGEDLPLPIAAQYGAIHEAAAKLKLLAATSGNGTPPLEAMEMKTGGMTTLATTTTTTTTTTVGAGTTPASTASKRVRYRECQKNHAAGIGGHALDGCGEFMPSGEEGLKCAACDCHRNFHRREVEGEQPPCDCYRYKKRPSTLLLPSYTSKLDGEDGGPSPYTPHSSGSMKKRFRTKFTPEQKERMLNFADKLGWRIQKHDEAEVQQFVNEVGVKRHVLKVWMHNNKHTLGKK